MKIHGNSMLRDIPDEDFWKLNPQLREIKIGQTLRWPYSNKTDMWFPMGAVLGMVVNDPDAHDLIPITVGQEGSTWELEEFMRPQDAIRVLISGHAWQISHRLTESIAFDFMRDIAQIRKRSIAHQLTGATFCARHHHMKGQMATRLLTLDNQSGQSGTIHLDQQSLASQLGVRREGITEINKQLVNQELITHTRGAMTIINYPGLIAKACPCYCEK
jgi:hypothetical protein